MPRLEKDIQIHILRYLRAMGAYAGKTKTMGVKRGRVFCFDPYTFRGFPDITCFYNGKLYFIEVKGEQGRLSPEQTRFKLVCKDSNTTYIVARSVDDVARIIN